MPPIDPLDALIDAATEVLALPVETSWRSAIRTNLDITLKMTRLVEEFPLPDEIEPASVYEA